MAFKSEAGDHRSKRLLVSPGVPYGRPPTRSWRARSVPASEDHTAAEALPPGQRPWSGSRYRASLLAPGPRASSRRSVRAPCVDIATYRARLASAFVRCPARLVADIHEATTRFSELLCPVEERGERVSVFRDRTPIAEIGLITYRITILGYRISGCPASYFTRIRLLCSPPKIGR